MSEKEVEFEVQGPVGVITMTRPKALNGMGKRPGDQSCGDPG